MSNPDSAAVDYRRAIDSRDADPKLIDDLLHRYGPSSLLELVASAFDRRAKNTAERRLQSSPDWFLAALATGQLAHRLGDRPFADVPYPHAERRRPVVPLVPRPIITDDGRWLTVVNRDEDAYNAAAGRSGVVYAGD